MDVAELIKAIILGVVEGITEFLPISSTGHIVLCQTWMGLDLSSPQSFWRTFAVFIQIGAIMAVVVYFRRKLLTLVLGRPTLLAAPVRRARLAGVGPGGASVDVELPADDTVEAADGAPPLSPADRKRIILQLALASLPALGIGFVTHGWIEENLGSPLIVAAALLVGGILMIAVEWSRPAVRTAHMETMSWRQALGVGCAQVLAVLFPGFSRSAATILGGMIAGLSRNAATEFSFFMAIPVMFAACGYSLLKFLLERPQVHAHELMLFFVGAVVAFAVAWAVIDWFMAYVRRHTFVPFAIYRIGLAVVVILATI